jgi:hypothetical protein
MTLIPWQAGRSLIWDVTVADTLASSHLPTTSQQSGGAAESAADRKESKYSSFTQSYAFVPIACETLGPIGSKAVEFLSDLGRRISSVTGDPREGSHLFQRISVAIQRFNCACFKGSFITPPDTES